MFISTGFIRDIIGWLKRGTTNTARAIRLRREWRKYCCNLEHTYGSTSLTVPKPSREEYFKISRSQSLRTIHRTKGTTNSSFTRELVRPRNPDTSCVATVGSSDNASVPGGSLVWLHIFNVVTDRGSSAHAVLVDATGVQDNVRNRALSRFIAVIAVSGPASESSESML